MPEDTAIPVKPPMATVTPSENPPLDKAGTPSMPPTNVMPQEAEFQPLSPISSLTVKDAPQKPTANSTTRSNSRLYVLITLIALVLIGVGAFLLSRLIQVETPATVATDETTQLIARRGALIIGTDATYPPMEFTDPAGTLVGYDIDFGRRVAEAMGLQADFRNIPWDDLFNALEMGQVDVVISGVTITDERQEKYGFSNAYLTAGQVIITQQTEQNISTTADLFGKRIAVQEGTTNHEQAILFTDPQHVLTYASFIEATEALVNGEADAIFSDVTNAKGILHNNPTLKIASDPFTQEQYGIVLRKQDTVLLKQINDTLNTLRQQGVLTYLKQKWLE